MFSRRHARTSHQAPSNQSTTHQRPKHTRTPLRRGLFQDGIWKCNCDPRMPAEQFQVKKENQNKGRWFYTCQKEQSKRCDFFLWKEDAQVREEGAVLGNSRDEPQRHPQAQVHVDAPPARSARQGTPPSNQHAPPKSPPPPYSVSALPKRKLPWKQYPAADESDTDSGDEYDISGGEERVMAAAAARMPETPRKAVKTCAADTPSKTPLKMGNGLMTPGTTPSKGRTIDVFAADERGGAKMSPQKTLNLLADTLEVLKEHNVRLGIEVVDKLHALYDKHEMKVQGIIKGRDISRLAVQSRDLKLSEQTQQIAALENQVESGKALAKHLREELATYKRH